MHIGISFDSSIFLGNYLEREGGGWEQEKEKEEEAGGGAEGDQRHI